MTASNATIHVCVQCLGQIAPTAAIHKCPAHAILGEDSPALAAVWDNPEDEAAYDVSDEAKAILAAEATAPYAPLIEAARAYRDARLAVVESPGDGLIWRRYDRAYDGLLEAACAFEAGQIEEEGGE